MTEKNTNSKVVLKPKGGLKAIFVHVLKPDDYGDEPKYTITVLIPKKDKKTLKSIRDAIDAATERGLENTFKGKSKNKLNIPLKDGDDEDTEKYPYYADCYFLKFSSKEKPGCMDTSRRALSTDDEVYSGMMVMVSGAAFPYNSRGNVGISFILGNIVKVADGERLGSGGFDIDDEFGDVLDEDEFKDDEEDVEEDVEETEEDEDNGELDLTEAKELIDEVKEIDKRQARKFARKLDSIDDEDDLDELIEELEDWIEENE